MGNNIVIISDTTAITNLYKIGKLQHIKWLFANIIIPKSVLSELLELEKNGRNIDEIKKADWITVASVNDTDLLAQLLTELDLGEAESIALAKEKSADYLIIDEKKRKKHSKQPEYKNNWHCRDFNSVKTPKKDTCHKARP